AALEEGKGAIAEHLLKGTAEAGVKVRKRESRPQAQIEEDELARAGRGGDSLLAGLCPAVLEGEIDVAARVALVPPSPAVPFASRRTFECEAVRAGADSEVGLGAPVGQVVPRLASGLRIVGDLVH